jgi:hypothetical protein
LNYSGSAIAELSTSYLHPTITMNCIPLEENINIDFDSALLAIDQDGSYVHQQQDGLWGLLS